MSKKKKELGVLQNKSNELFVKSQIEKMTKLEKEEKIKELEKIGYEYNNGIHVILDMKTIIPIDFLLYCLLIDDRDKIQTDNIL